MIKTVHELTGYSEKYINQIAAGEIKTRTQARSKVEKAIEILNRETEKAGDMVIKAMAEIDLLYVKTIKDLMIIPDSFLIKKYKTSDREVIFAKCEKRGYY